MKDPLLWLDEPGMITGSAAPEQTTPAIEAVAPTAPVEPVAEQPAATVELPPGSPADVPQPPWWPEFCAILGSIRLLAARRQRCSDPGCGFPVMVEWESPGYPRQWSCPKCGRTAAAGQLSVF